MRKIFRVIRKIYRRKKTIEYFWKLRKKIIKGKGGKLIRHFNEYRYNKIMERNCAGVPWVTQIDECPKFPHGLSGIFISVGAKIGKGCTIFHQVTIGSNTLTDSKNYGFPVIGDNVYIGAGAKIIGGVKVGNNVRIGANCVVVKDIPDNSTVVASPAVIIQHTSARENKFLDANKILREKKENATTTE